MFSEGVNAKILQHKEFHILYVKYVTLKNTFFWLSAIQHENDMQKGTVSPSHVDYYQIM